MKTIVRNFSLHIINIAYVTDENRHPTLAEHIANTGSTINRWNKWTRTTERRTSAAAAELVSTPVGYNSYRQNGATFRLPSACHLMTFHMQNQFTGLSVDIGTEVDLKAWPSYGSESVSSFQTRSYFSVGLVQTQAEHPGLQAKFLSRIWSLILDRWLELWGRTHTHTHTEQ